MDSRHVIRLSTAIILMVGLAYWVTSPSGSVAVGPDCAITGLGNRIAAAVQPHRFWRAQLVALRDTAAVLEQLQAASTYGPADNGGKIETPEERRMDRLSEKAEAQARAEQQARLDQIAWMSKCEGVVAGRLAGLKD